MSDPQQHNENEANDDNVEVELTMAQSVFKGIIGLGLFAIVTAGLIALTQVSTADRIAEEEKRARSKALFEIVPLEQHDNDMLQDAL